MCDGVELIGVAVSPVAGLVFAAINVGAEVPLHIPCNDEVEPAIAVVIYEGRACAPTAATDARLGSHIGESPVAIIVIKSVSAEVRHQKVSVAVVVVVAGCDSHAVQAPLQTSFLSDVGKGAIAIVVIQPVPETRIGFVWRNAAWHRIQDLCSIREE